MILTVIVFILVLGLLIFIHELGHFVTAKRAGVKVEEFGFGYPPRIFGVKKGETIYSLNLLPLGGFVKIYGENGLADDASKVNSEDAPRAFCNKSLGRRAIILVAGVVMNLILAMVLLSIGHGIGLPTVVDDSAADNLHDTKIQITQVAADSPAAAAGLNVGDTIKQLNNSVAVLPQKVGGVQTFVNSHLGEQITVVIQRGDLVLTKELTPRRNYPEDEGAMGIGLARTAIVAYPWYLAVIMGVTSTLNLVWIILVVLGGIFWRLVSTGQLAAEVSGPVGIFNLTGQAARLGFIYVLQLTALLSINLAIINIFPFPALDGGRLLFLGLEKIKGSPVSQKIEGMIHTTGFVFLVLLLLAITWRDIVRLF